jgi:hypothetical protein
VRTSLSIAAIILVAGLAPCGCRRTLELGFPQADAQAGDADADTADAGDTGGTDSELDGSVQDGSVRISDGFVPE